MAANHITFGDDPALACCECGRPSIFHLLAIEHGKSVDECYLCEEHAQNRLHPYSPSSDKIGSGVRETISGARRFDIEALISKSNGWGTIYLRERGGSHQFQIDLGPIEGSVLYWNLKGNSSPRPLTHEVFVTTIRALGGAINRVLVDRFSEDQAFLYAYLHVDQANAPLQVDMRPSDVLNLAVVCGAPIFISEKLLEN